MLTKDMINAAVKMAQSRGRINYVAVANETVKAFLKEKQPNRHMLYDAGWKAGYTVNGVKP